MSKSCKGLAMELVKCLSESDCVKVQNWLCRECAGEKEPCISSEYVGLRETYFNCKRGQGWIFFLSLLDIVPLAERMGYVTEQLAFCTGPTVGGLLNATFGNATEMIISIYVLKNGMIRVVQQSLLGSILSNMLLVLGCAFFADWIVRKKVHYFDKAAALVNSGLLLMAVMGIMFPAMLHFTRTEVHFGKSELALLRFSSCVVLENNQEDIDEEEVPELTKGETIGWLAVLTFWISLLSGYFADAFQGASVNMPVAFISVILLPIVGIAAEHASAIMFSMKDKLNISLGVAIGSCTQISMFVILFCVVVGWFMGEPMDMNFQLLETATLFITVLVVAYMLQEGTSNYFKGLMLIFATSSSQQASLYMLTLQMMITENPTVFMPFPEIGALAVLSIGYYIASIRPSISSSCKPEDHPNMPFI